MQDPRITLFVEVLLPLPLPRLYTYRVPMEWNELVHERARVLVQFGARKVYTGLIVNITEQPPTDYTANYILELLDEEPLISKLNLDFWFWISRYYMCNAGDVMAAALPAGFRLKSESVVFLSADYLEQISDVQLSAVEYEIISALENSKPKRISELQKSVTNGNMVKYLKSLYSRGILLFEEEVKENYKPKFEKWIVLNTEIEEEQMAETLDLLQSKRKKQFEALMIIAGNSGQKIKYSTLTKEKNISTAVIKKLLELGVIVEEMEQISRLDSFYKQGLDYTLSAEQTKAVQECEVGFEKNKRVLLEGVTGSGKTFIYVELIKKTIALGKQALCLLPEVAITESIVGRIAYYFKRIGVWHPFYSMHEKTELFEKLRNGEIDVLIASKNGIFAPFKDLGIVVVDEEHESTYKQFERKPYYNARDAAIYLAGLYNANVILGSATPSFNALQQVAWNKLWHVRLNNRYEVRPKLNYELVNIKREMDQKNMFSLALLKSINNSLNSGKQIILYNNKRGYVPYISCDVCGYTDECKNCDISLAYYKNMNMQKCAYCNTKYQLAKSCAKCGSTNLSMRGYGTERIAEECSLLFPTAVVERFDNESISKKGDFERIMRSFENGKIHILVGTHLLCKGIDFKNVGTVGIVDADSFLKFPSYRAHERTFQLIKQLTGRAGDKNTIGEIIIQTQNPESPIFSMLMNDEYDKLFYDEMPLRRSYMYPPFSRLIQITCRHSDFKESYKAAALIYRNLVKIDTIYVSEPVVPLVGRIRNKFLHQLNIKIGIDAKNLGELKYNILEILNREQKENKGVLIDVDVDPQ